MNQLSVKTSLQAMHANQSGEPASILFVDKVFLKPRRAIPLRGVEVFNLNLIRDLRRLRYPVDLILSGSWTSTVRHQLGEDSPQLIIVPETGLDFLNALVAGCSRRLGRYDVLLIGNVGKSLIPMIRILQIRRRFAHVVLIAHREANRKFAQLSAALPGHVIAVNSLIAKPFIQFGHPHVWVDYGINNANEFYPGEREVDELVHFVVMGMLDNAWKGADTAIAAFRLLPESVRDRCRLHLASYTHPPDLGDDRIVAYSWMPLGDVPGFLRGMDVMLVPSRDEGVMRETFSQVAVQGMLTGLPLLVSDLMVLREKVDAGGGSVFRNEKELASKMAEWAEQPGERRRLGEEARHTALDRYVWDTARFAARYLEEHVHGKGNEDDG